MDASLSRPLFFCQTESLFHFTSCSEVALLRPPDRFGDFSGQVGVFCSISLMRQKEMWF
jgi:hypothetical protein